MSPSVPTQRVVCYVDGFNLYFGLRDSGLRKYYWLNVRELALRLLRAGQSLAATKYFTSRISGGLPGDAPQRAAALNARRKRQSDYLEALKTVGALDILQGHFLEKAVTCRNCGVSWRTFEEKMTDVNIATELLSDAFRDRFDVALIVSGDSDLTPPIRRIRAEFPHKRIVVAFPPGRSSRHLEQASNAYFTIGRKKLKDSQFPDSVAKPDGHMLRRPAHWR